MRKTDLTTHFGGVAKTARAFGLTRAAVYQWPDIVPEKIAYKAQVMTGGLLRVDPALYPRRSSAA